jgi:hypothetical protein
MLVILPCIDAIWFFFFLFISWVKYSLVSIWEICSKAFLLFFQIGFNYHISNACDRTLTCSMSLEQLELCYFDTSLASDFGWMVNTIQICG